MAYELFVLRLLHVGLGTFWVGTVLFNALYLSPALRAAGPAAAGAVMGSMMRRRFMVVMPVIAIVTILTGLRLLMIASGGDAHWFQHRVGHTYSVAGGLAIIAFLVGIFVVRPTMGRVGNLAQSATSDGTTRDALAAEMARLQRRAVVSNQIVAVLLVLATAGMAIARYL